MSLNTRHQLPNLVWSEDAENALNHERRGGGCSCIPPAPLEAPGQAPRPDLTTHTSPFLSELYFLTFTPGAE